MTGLDENGDDCNLTRMSDEEAEKRLEALVEAEADLREKRISNSSGSESRMDLTVTSSRLSRGRVVGGERDQGLRLDVEVDGGVESFVIPWPRDPNNRMEPLVRLCRANGVGVDRVASIDYVWIVEADCGDRGILIPPPSGSIDTTVVLPGGREVNMTRPSVSSFVNRVIHLFLLVMLRTRFGTVKAWYTGFISLPVTGMVPVSVVTALLTLAAISALIATGSLLFVPWILGGLLVFLTAVYFHQNPLTALIARRREPQ